MTRSMANRYVSGLSAMEDSWGTRTNLGPGGVSEITEIIFHELKGTADITSPRLSDLPPLSHTDIITAILGEIRMRG